MGFYKLGIRCIISCYWHTKFNFCTHRAGAFYIFLTIFYIPLTNTILKKRLGFPIPITVKIITGIFVFWATLAVGDLMQMFESWLGV